MSKGKHILKLVSKLTLSLMAMLFIINSCTKPFSVKWVYYDETVCSDKWTFTNNNEVLKDRITDHLKGKGIKVFDIEIFIDGTADACTECQCKTGRRIKCKIAKRDLSDAKSEGFYE